MTKGSHDSREMVDTRSKVNVKRLFRRALFCCCEEMFLSWNFLQIPMLQAQTMNRDGKENDIQQKEAALDEIKKFAMLNTAERRPASVQMMKIIM